MPVDLCLCLVPQQEPGMHIAQSGGRSLFQSSVCRVALQKPRKAVYNSSLSSGPLSKQSVRVLSMKLISRVATAVESPIFLPRETRCPIHAQAQSPKPKIPRIPSATSLQEQRSNSYPVAPILAWALIRSNHHPKPQSPKSLTLRRAAAHGTSCP